MSNTLVVENFRHEAEAKAEIPLFASHISVGPPSPADRSICQNMDLNEFLIKNSTATFFVRVEGTSMIDAGIHPGDILIVDKSLDPLPNSVVIAIINGEFLVKRLITECGGKYLVPDNPSFERIELGKSDQVEIWGVVVWVIHKLR